MAVHATLAGSSVSLFGSDDHIGRRIVVILSCRDEAVTSEMSGPAWGWELVHAEGTLPLDSGGRRGIAMWQAIVPPEAIGTNAIVGTWRNTGGTAVDTRIRYIVMDEGADFTLVGAVAADSGLSTVNQLAVGPTADAPPGDHLVIAAAVARGHLSSPVWNTTDLTPPNPLGGDWNLLEQNGTATTGIETGGGYLTVTGAGAVAYSDTYGSGGGNARMVTAILAVWSTDAGGGANLADTITETAAATDTVTASLTVSRELIETAVATDQGDNYALDITQSLVETATATDTVVATIGSHSALVETGAGTDTAAATLTVGRDLTETATATDTVVVGITGASAFNLTLTALAPVLGHGPATTPALVARTALAPELEHGAAGEHVLNHASASEPELAHDAGEPALAHGDADEPTLVHGAPGTPTT